MEKFFDADHPVYRPLWVRLLLTAICLGWATFELSTGALVWGVLFLAMGGWCIWRFFVTFERQ